MSRHKLGLGELVQLVPTGGGSATEGIVELVEHRLLRVRTQGTPVQVGEAVRVQHVVPDDARYTIDALVQALESPSVVLKKLGEWSRVQQREYVRLRLEAKVYADLHASAPGPELPSMRAPLDLRARVVDLSAGGLQLETSVDLGLGVQVFVRFELPGGEPVATTGLVVRRGRAIRDTHRFGVRFVNLAPPLETVIVRFIYAQQAEKRRRTIT